MRSLAVATVASAVVVATTTNADYVPFGFQTGVRPSRSGDSASDVGNDDSYAGSAVYDPVLHSVYVSGGTYANYFDRHVRGSTTHDAHLGESDCFLAALRLPPLPKADDDRGGGRRTMTGDGAVRLETSTGAAVRRDASSSTKFPVEDPSNVPRMLYSHRFGTRSSPEVCSAVCPLPFLDADDGNDGGTAKKPSKMSRRLLAIGHSQEGGLLTSLRRKGSDMATVYGYAMDVDVALDHDPTESGGAGGGGGGSGVEGKDGVRGGSLFHDVRVQYPVAIDDDGRGNAYVALMDSAVDDRNPNYDPEEFDRLDRPDLTAGGGGGDGGGGRGGGNPQKFGKDYDLRIKKLSIKTSEELSADAAEKVDLGEPPTTPEGYVETLHVRWSRPYKTTDRQSIRPSALLFVPGSSNPGSAENPDGVVLFAGSTAGYGPEFGSDVMSAGDLDGFVTKVDPDTGDVPKPPDMNPGDYWFGTTFSVRIATNPGSDEIVGGLCVRPSYQQSDNFDYDPPNAFYVAGSTTGILAPGIEPSSRGSNYHAYLMKIDLDTMNSIWKRQLGYVSGPLTEEGKEGSVLGISCAVSPDGNDVYLAGVVTNGSDLDVTGESSNGGDDLFVAKYDADDGTIAYAKQIGTSQDDRLARGGGGVSVDPIGNAILTGTTRGSLMRWRGEPPEGDDAATPPAADVFVLSVSREDGSYRRPMEQVASEVPLDGPDDPRRDPDPSSSSQTGNDDDDRSLTAVGIFSIVVFCCGFVLSFAAIAYKYRARRSSSGTCTRKSAFKKEERKNKSVSNYLQDFEDVEVDLKHSATGGWHGMYDLDGDGASILRRGPPVPPEEVTVTLTSSTTSPPRRTASMGSATSGSFVQDSLFMDDEHHAPGLGGDGEIGGGGGLGGLDDVHGYRDNERNVPPMYDDDNEEPGGIHARRRTSNYGGLVDAYNRSWDERNPHALSGPGGTDQNGLREGEGEGQFAMPGSGAGSHRTETKTTLVEDDGWGQEII